LTTYSRSFYDTGPLTDRFEDYPYDSIKEAQDWWKGVNLTPDEKEAVARGNAVRIFNLPLEA
jgi:predicted TIM-barrel fold metal-dependent hydrolase